LRALSGMMGERCRCEVYLMAPDVTAQIFLRGSIGLVLRKARAASRSRSTILMHPFRVVGGIGSYLISPVQFPPCRPVPVTRRQVDCRQEARNAGMITVNLGMEVHVHRPGLPIDMSQRSTLWMWRKSPRGQTHRLVELPDKSRNMPLAQRSLRSASGASPQ
jgi:hypothetical protein